MDVCAIGIQGTTATLTRVRSEASGLAHETPEGMVIDQPHVYHDLDATDWLLYAIAWAMRRP